MRRLVLWLALITIALSTWPACDALAQDRVWRIGLLDLNPPPTEDRPSYALNNFKRGLGDLGYQEGRNYVIETRFANADRSRLQAFAKELVDRGVDVIVTVGTPTTGAAIKATATIPIVMTGSENPVGHGFIASLAHPGGNVTGLTHNPGPEFAGKSLQLLKDAAPQISRVAILQDGAGNSDNLYINVQRAVARYLNLTLLIHELGGVQSADDYDAVLAAIIAERADALFVYADFISDKYQDRLVQFISKTYRVPTMFQQARFVEAGGLMSYYTSFDDLRRQAAVFVDKIFKGAKPADLPVQQPSRFEFIVNLKTAKMLGLTMSPSILSFADKIIE